VLLYPLRVITDNHKVICYGPNEFNARDSSQSFGHNRCYKQFRMVTVECE
jgi:hypothetical protein